MERFAIKFDEDVALNLCKICRLCGTKNSAEIAILENNPTLFGDGDAELWKKILTCVGVKVTRNDKMPQNICHLCHDKILDFFEFREMCLSIDLQTRKFLGVPLIDIKKDADFVEKKKKAQRRKAGKDDNSSINSKLVKLTVKSEISGNKRKKSTTTKNARGKLKTMENKKQMNDQKYEFNFTNTNIEAIMNSQLAFIGDEIMNKKNKVCFICGEECNLIKFEEHLITMHIPRVVPYHCVRCNETIMKKVDVKNHNLWHKLSKTPFTCGRCSKNIDSLGGYTRHINECLIFDKSNIYETQKCNECNREFETQNLYNWHPCVISKLKCPKCHKMFTTSGNTLKHITRCSVKTVRPIKPQINHPSIKVEKHFTENNAFVVIPSSAVAAVTSNQLEIPTNKKSKKITKKDMQRFDNLLKDAYETLQNIKQEPKDQNITDNHHEHSDINVSRPEEEESFHHGDNDDLYSSADDDDDLQNTAANVKQEDIDINYTDFEKIVSESNISSTEIQKEQSNLIEQIKTDKQQQHQQQQQQPTIKLKIKKEHGTLNSSLIEENNVDLSGNSSYVFEESNIRKKKRKKKKVDKEVTGMMSNIKQEPIEQDNLQTDQNETDNCDETEDCEAESSTLAEVTNVSNKASLPIISVVSSLANPSSDQNSDQSKLPIISSVYSAVTELPITQSTTLGVVIKQEIMDDMNDPSYRTNENLNVISKDAESHISEQNNSSKSTSSTLLESRLIMNEDETVTESINRGTSMDVEIFQIKKEIDYEEYVNQTCEEQNNEIFDNENESDMTNITVKEEIHLSYDENLMDCDYENDNEANIKTDERSDVELNRCENFSENTNEISLGNENKNNQTGAADAENNLNLNASDSVFTFKKIVLKNYESTKTEGETLDNYTEKDKQSSKIESSDETKGDENIEKSALYFENIKNDEKNFNEVVMKQDSQSDKELYCNEDEDVSLRKNNCEKVNSQSDIVTDSNSIQNDDDVNMMENEDKEIINEANIQSEDNNYKHAETDSEKTILQNNKEVDSNSLKNDDIVVMEVEEIKNSSVDDIFEQKLDTNSQEQEGDNLNMNTKIPEVTEFEAVKNETSSNLSMTSVLHEINDVIKTNNQSNENNRQNSENFNLDENIVGHSSKNHDKSQIDNVNELINDTSEIDCKLEEIVDSKLEVKQLDETKTPLTCATETNDDELQKSEGRNEISTTYTKSNINDSIQVYKDRNENKDLNKSTEVKEGNSSKVEESMHLNTAESLKNASINSNELYDSNKDGVVHNESIKNSNKDSLSNSESINICDLKNEIVSTSKDLEKETEIKSMISDEFFKATTSSNTMDKYQNITCSNLIMENSNETILENDNENLEKGGKVHDELQINRH